MNGKEIDRMAYEATAGNDPGPIISLLGEALANANEAIERTDNLRCLLLGGDPLAMNGDSNPKCVLDAAIQLVKFLKDINGMLDGIEKGISG